MNLPQPSEDLIPPDVTMRHFAAHAEWGTRHVIEVPKGCKLNVTILTELLETMLNGEPVFILRAQDNVSSVGILAYQNKIRDLLQRIIVHAGDVVSVATNNALNNVLQRTTAALQKFFNWQRQNPTRLKQAD